ncbi:hypothetical protein D9M72_519850 [compost metagenome]
MGVGRGADDDGVDVVSLFDRLDGAHIAAILLGDGFGGGREGVGNGDEHGIRIAADGFRVNLADASGAQKTKSDCHLSFSRIPARDREGA